jgi:phenylacetate-CoA ligase
MHNNKMFSNVETFERSKIREIQLTHLKNQLIRCFELSPFYRKKLKAIGFEPSDLKHLEQIQSLPFTYKYELRDTQARNPPWGDLLLPDPGSWVEVHPSTGTTGVPIFTIWTQKDIAHITEYAARMLWSVGIRKGDILHNAFRYGLRMGGITVQRVAERIGCFVLPVGDGDIKTQLEFLVNLKPNVLFATPSFAFVLAERLRKRRIDPGGLPLKIGCFGGEPGIQVRSTRNRLEMNLGIKAFDIYGLAEVGPLLSAECEERDGIHWAEDHHLVEIINPNTLKPCAPGEIGVLVITDLTRDAMPLIRYWTNDFAKLDYNKCKCGRTHAKSPGGILGRADDMVNIRGVKFYPSQVENVVRRYDEVGNEFKILLYKNEHTSFDYCIIKVECIFAGQGVEELQEKLRKELCDELKINVEVELVPFGMLERELLKAQRVLDYRQMSSSLHKEHLNKQHR